MEVDDILAKFKICICFELATALKALMTYATSAYKLQNLKHIAQVSWPPAFQKENTSTGAHNRNKL